MVVLLSACDKYALDVFARTEPAIVIDGPQVNMSMYCGADSTNLFGFESFIKSFDCVDYQISPSGMTFSVFIGESDLGETKRALEGIDGVGYVVNGTEDRLVIAGTDKTWTALALYALEDFLFTNGMAVKDSLLTFPPEISLKEDYKDPQLISLLIQRGYTFSLEPKFILGCPGLGDCVIGQGATSDGTFFYVNNKNGSDTQTIIFRFDMETLKWKGQSAVFNAGHANDLAYNPDSELIIVAHGLKQGNILTLVNSRDLSVIGDIKIGVGTSSVSYNDKQKLYAFSQGGSSLHITDGDFRLIKSVDRSITQGYTTQGMGADDTYIYFPMSGSRDNVIVVYDWEGQYITTLTLDTKLESETLFYSRGEYYINFNHLGSELYRIDPILYYSHN